MKRFSFISVIAVLAFGLASVARASTFTVFESWSGENYCPDICGGSSLRDTWYGSNSRVLVGQQFRVSDTAFLTQMIVGFTSDSYRSTDTLSFTLTLTLDDGGRPGQVLETVDYAGPLVLEPALATPKGISVSFSGNTLIEEDKYYWVVASPLGADHPIWWMPSDRAYPGVSYGVKPDSGPESGYERDWEFGADAAYALRVIGSDPASAVPLPGAAWLMGTGLLGLGALSRRVGGWRGNR